MNERFAPIELILSDVDGVWTTGEITFVGDEELKTFHVRDGLGVKLWMRAGHRFGLLSSRRSSAVTRRARELGIDLVRQGEDDKRGAARRILEELGLDARQVCYIGDDLPDIPLLREVGLAVAVADAAAETRAAAHVVTRASGGRGAVREIVESILVAQGRWDAVIREHATP